MKKWMIIAAAWMLSFSLYAMQQITVNPVSFFQTPTQGVEFDYADVYVTQDVEYAQKNQTYQNEAWQRTDYALNGLVDKEGRFSVWKFVPSYLKHNNETPKRLVVEILLYNEPVQLDSTMQPINDEDEYLIPYKVRYRYKLSYSDGSPLLEKDYGTIYGTYQTKNVDFTTEFPVDSRVGIQAVLTRVRQEVYALYGFSSFEMPFSLYDFSKIPGLDLLQKQLVDQIGQKEGLMLDKKAQSIMTAYADVLSYHLHRLGAQEQAYANRNLALCKAWLGDATAIEHLEKYKSALTTSQDTIDYFSVDLFVKYYPQGITKYAKLLNLLAGNLQWMVDAATYNDLLCSVYEVEYPIPFLPIKQMQGKVKKVSGELIQEGKEPLNFTLKFNKEGLPKSLDMSRVEYDDNKKNTVRTNTLHISYRKNEFDKITCSSTQLVRLFMPGIDALNQPVDRMEQIMHCKTDNVLGGFVKFKVATEETNQFMFDTDGNVYIRGEKSLSRPHGLLKKIADETGEKFPAMVSANSSAYEMLVNIDENGFVTHYDWDGYVLMEKNVGYDNYAYIKADSVALRISMQEPYGAQPGVMTHEVSLRVENKLNKVKSDVAVPASSVQLKHQWMFDVKYDEYGNWTYLKVGPYEVKRTIIYQ